MDPLRTSLLLALLLALASCHCNNDCIRERNAEVEKDERVFDCRMCKAIEVNVDDNCPMKGYECDKDLKMSANVLTPMGCECSQMKCADANATLIIEKELVPKIHCRNQTWTTTSGNVVESAVCARKCDACAINPIGGDFVGDDRLIPFTSVAPNANRACANGQCPNGAFVSNEGEIPVVKPVSMWFSCSGDGSWKSILGNNPTGHSYRRLQCINKQCAPLPAATCDNNKFSCQTPQPEMPLSDLPIGIQQVLGCTDKHQLRSTNLQEPIGPVSCQLGAWFKGTSEISDSTPVTCITCKAIVMNAPLPVETGDNRNLHCEDGKTLTITWQAPGSSWPKTTGTPSSRIYCTDQFTWASEGITFSDGYTTLAEVVADNLHWFLKCA